MKLYEMLEGTYYDGNIELELYKTKQGTIMDEPVTWNTWHDKVNGGIPEHDSSIADSIKEAEVYTMRPGYDRLTVCIGPEQPDKILQAVRDKKCTVEQGVERLNDIELMEREYRDMLNEMDW